MERVPILLDTDIGDDIDDALALGLICGSPELELRAVTTVFGNVTARARQAQTLLQIAGGESARVPVAAGCGRTLASRPLAVQQAGLELLPGQSVTSWSDERLPPLDGRHGVDVMIEELMNGPGQVVPVTIGAMTNLAMARTKEPRLVGRISQVVAMAGEFDRPKAEWNIRCDPEAAHLIFTSGVRVTVVPFSLGRAARFHGEEVQQLRQSDRPLARHLAETIAAWRGAWRQPTGQPSLYDPAAVAALLRPELFVWQTGRVQVELRGEQTYGYTTFTPGEGPHRVARELKTEEFVKWLMARLVGEG